MLRIEDKRQETEMSQFSDDESFDEKTRQTLNRKALRIYVAGPLRNGQDARRMKKLGMTLRNEGYDVYMACDLDERNPKIRFERDISEIDKRDLLVAHFEKMTFGTIFEIGYAFARGKKVILLSKMRELEKHPFVMNGCKLISSSVEDLIKILRNETARATC